MPRWSGPAPAERAHQSMEARRAMRRVLCSSREAGASPHAARREESAQRRREKRRRREARQAWRETRQAWARAGFNLRYEDPPRRFDSFDYQTDFYTWLGNSTTATPTTNYTFQAATDLWQDTGTYSANIINLNGQVWHSRQPVRPSAYAEVILSVELLEEHPDPDAMLGAHYDMLERRLREEIERVDPERIWRGWVASLADVRFDERTQVLRASAAPSSRDETLDVWQGWARDVQPLQGEVATVPPRPTAEELRRQHIARERDRRIRATRRHSAELKARVARRKARQLLVDHLSPEQREEFEELGVVTVVLANGHVYEIATGYAGNVHRMHRTDEYGGRRAITYCIHGPSYLPDYDQMLAQKLLLEHSEEEFLRIANATHRMGVRADQIVDYVPNRWAVEMARTEREEIEAEQQALRAGRGQVFRDGTSTTSPMGWQMNVQIDRTPFEHAVAAQIAEAERQRVAA